MVFVPDIIALKHHTALELSGRVVLFEFRSFFNADVEDTTYVSLLVQLLRFGGDVSPLSNS